MCAKYYENPIMLSRVTAKNVGDVFILRHTVDCRMQVGRLTAPSVWLFQSTDAVCILIRALAQGVLLSGHHSLNQL